MKNDSLPTQVQPQTAIPGIACGVIHKAMPPFVTLSTKSFILWPDYNGRDLL